MILNLTIDIGGLDFDTQKSLYLFLRNKFEPKNDDIFLKYESILNKKIKCLGMSSRTYSVLINFEIRTIQDLCSCSISFLEKIKGLGKVSLREIEETLNEWGLCLSQ